MSTPLELLHFPYSHFNEKVRWGLEYKKVPTRRLPCCPGRIAAESAV